MAEQRDQRNSDEIRRDIEGTRSELHRTVDALERKLSVGQIVDEVWDRMGGRSVISSTASSFGDTVRDHPVPLALMGLGVAWLAVERKSATHTEPHTGTYERADGRVGPYRGDAVHETGSSKLEGAKSKAKSVAHKAKAGARSVKEGATTAKETASAVTEATKHTASRARDMMRSSDDDDDRTTDGGDGGVRLRAAHAAERAREEVGHRSRQAKRGFRSAMEEQPLALGAVAFGLGLASGLSVPTTRLEDETMGHASDVMKDEVRTVAKDVKEDAKAVAKDAMRSAKEEADRQGVGEDLKHSAREIAAEAKQTAKARSEERNLEPGGMKERASEAMERTRERGTD